MLADETESDSSRSGRPGRRVSRDFARRRRRERSRRTSADRRCPPPRRPRPAASPGWPRRRPAAGIEQPSSFVAHQIRGARSRRREEDWTPGSSIGGRAMRWFQRALSMTVASPTLGCNRDPLGVHAVEDMRKPFLPRQSDCQPGLEVSKNLRWSRGSPCSDRTDRHPLALGVAQVDQKNRQAIGLLLDVG